MSSQSGDVRAQLRLNSGHRSPALRRNWTAWYVSFALAGGLLALGDALAHVASFGALGVAAACGAALLAGGAAGVLFGALMVCAQQLRPLWCYAAWLVIASGPCAWLADRLNAIANLGGRYHAMAIAVLAGCCVAALGFAGLMLLFHQRSRVWLEHKLEPGRVHWLVVGILVVSLAATLSIDGALYADDYAAAHWALRSAGVLLLAATLYELLLQNRVTPRHGWWTTGAMLGLGSASFLLLGGSSAAYAAAIAQRPFTSLGVEALRSATDFDQDGFSSLLGGGDCDPFNAAVNPQAHEIPNNGVDDNCLGGDATDPMDVLTEETPLVATPVGIDVVLITIDTVRPDHLSVYGYERDTSPNLKRWAEGAARYTNAYTSGGWTSLAVPSLMRGTYPRRLFWSRFVETSRYRYLRESDRSKLRKKEKIRARFLLPIDDPRMPLAAHLKRRGMRTLAVVDSGFTEVLSAKWGLGEGFDEYHEVSDEPRARRNDATTAERALQSLDQISDQERFFMWVHFFGPHKPSSKHEGFHSWGSRVVDEYDHELLYVDHHVGRLLDELGARGGDQLIIVSSDHGEYIATGRSHGTNAAEANLRIPLLIKGPSFEPGEHNQLASLVDIMPTVLTATGTPLPSWLDGESLQGLTREKAEERSIFMDTFIVGKNANERGAFRTDFSALMHGPYKLVRDRVKQTLVLNRRDDPKHPATNVLDETPVPELEGALNFYIESAGGSPRVLDR